MCVSCRAIAEESTEGEGHLLLIWSFTLFLHILKHCFFVFSFSPVTGLVSMGLVQLLLPISQAMYQWLVHLLPHQPVQLPPPLCLPLLSALTWQQQALLGCSLPLRGTGRTLLPILEAFQLLSRVPWIFPSHLVHQVLRSWLRALQPCQSPHPDSDPQQWVRLCLLLHPVPRAGVRLYWTGFLLGISQEHKSVFHVCSAGCGMILQFGRNYVCAELTLLTQRWFLHFGLH